MRFHQFAWARDQGGRLIPGCSIFVYLAGTNTPANIYAAQSGGSPVNSVVADNVGFWEFWVDSASYAISQLFKITQSYSGFLPKTIDNIQLYPAAGSYGIAGEATLAAGVYPVVFANTEFDINYVINLSPNANENVWWSAKATTGFTINSSNGGSTAKVGWRISR